MKMAKAKAGPNKSEKIRAALTATPDKPAPEIAKDLGVTAGLVYNIKANMKKKAGQPTAKRGRKPGSKMAPKAAAPAGAHSALDAAFEFIHKVGGVLHAEALIAKLKALKEKL
jgi:transposase